MRQKHDWVMVYKHRGFTTQIPPAPIHKFKSRWKYVVLFLKLLV